MGRRQYLARLALGLSPFEDPEPGHQDDEGGSRAPTQQVDFGHRVQQYDSKGRPVNPRIDKFNAELRSAQNEVLSLTGIVEKKDHADQMNDLRWKYIDKQRKQVLDDENDRGELVEFFLPYLRILCHAWPDAIRQRIQIGLYDRLLPVSEILGTEWKSMWRGGIKHSLAALFPALGASSIRALVRLPLVIALEDMIGRLQTSIGKRIVSRKARERMHVSLEILFEVLLMGIDIALLPLSIHASAQRLGLAPPLPILPPYTTFLPWHTDNVHQFAWSSSIGPRFLKKFTSPASLLLIYNAIHYEVDGAEVPTLSFLSTYRYQPITNDPKKASPPGWKDPAGRMLHCFYNLRVSIIQWTGWRLVQRNDKPHLREGEHFENDTTVDAVERNTTPLPFHRSTALAHLPPQFLASVIDKFFSRLIALPFESLMLRTLARSYSSAVLVPQPTSGLQAAPHLYTPFGGDSLAQVLFCNNSSSKLGLGNYLNHLGLSLALIVSVDAILFFGVYYSVRHIGTKYLDWGGKGKIGKVIYSEEGLRRHAGELEEMPTTDGMATLPTVAD